MADCTIYVTHFPCADCTRAIIQKRIKRVVIDNSSTLHNASRWLDNMDASKEMLLEAGVELLMVDIDEG
jgi:dCMP deaminase